MGQYKFAVGDRVRVKKRREKVYKEILFNDSMAELEGKIFEISNRQSTTKEGVEIKIYELKKAGWYWVEHWLEPVDKPAPERPTDFLPGDRVRMKSGGQGFKNGTVIAEYSPGHIAVDWAPWNRGHRGDLAFKELGYPTGTQLPNDSCWYVGRDDIILIQRGNIVYEEE